MTGTAPPPPTLTPPGDGDDVAWGGSITADMTGLRADTTLVTADHS
jgi:hypothetical protein